MGGEFGGEWKPLLFQNVIGDGWKKRNIKWLSSAPLLLGSDSVSSVLDVLGRAFYFSP